MSKVSRILAAVLLLVVSSAPAPARAADPDPKDWTKVLEAAKGQTVYFNAWAGEPRINAYIAWAGEQVERRFGVKVVHVKLTDTAEAVARVLAEKSAGTNAGGAVDLIWINGENFASMKRNGLLFGPWADRLPNYPLLDAANNPDVTADFSVPVEGLEMPWSRAQIVFYSDTATVKQPPRSAKELAAWAAKNPGRFTYPLPPNFLGTTFMKQTLIELAADKAPLYAPADQADFAKVTAPLWAYLDALHPNLWRGGKSFPQNASAMRRMLGDSEIDIAFSFGQTEASAAIAKGELPDTVRSFVLEAGTIGNVSFLGIPFNAANKAGAMVLSNFLLTPEAQLRKHDPAYWGSFTVLSLEKLTAVERAAFAAVDLGVAALPPDKLGPVVPEPHPSWSEALEREWLKRYGAR